MTNITLPSSFDLLFDIKNSDQLKEKYRQLKTEIDNMEELMDYYRINKEELLYE